MKLRLVLVTHYLSRIIGYNVRSGIEVVLMDGTITRFGGKVMDSEGYDFLGLMTGSEGGQRQ